MSARKKEQEHESLFAGFTREGVASRRSGPSTQGDRPALRGIASDHQTLFKTAA